MSLIELLIVVLVIAWLAGWSFVGGSLVHILLAVVIVLILIRLLRGQSVG